MGTIAMVFWYLLVILAGVGALGYSGRTAQQILALPTGDPKMVRIARAIQEGATAYLTRQYSSIFVVALVGAVFLWWSFSKNHWVPIGFVLGAILSGVSGVMGMMISVRANVRTTEAAKGGVAQALSVAFRSGSITGFLVAGLGLLGVVLYTLLLKGCGSSTRAMMEGLVGLGFGSSLISLFARIGGGIFTKGADVGADLVGKVEAGIPEDDPRNPAVIADNVGDNVGDCAGMGADLFETYVVTLVACMQMALLTAPTESNLFLYPMVVCGLCMVGCLAGTFAVWLADSIMGALYQGLVASMVASVGAVALGTWIFPSNTLFSKWNLLACVVIGVLLTGALVWITEFYTAFRYRPVRSIAKASETGAGTNLIQGLAVSMESCFLPVLAVGAAIVLAYSCAGLFGIALAATSMLGLMGMIIAIDAYGPVTDNAGGIAEMAGLPPEVRAVTDQLDAVGNTTKAITKGYAIGSAALSALVLFSAYTQEVTYYLKLPSITFDLQNPLVVVGLLLGGSIPYLFSSMSMKAVGQAGGAIVMEVRRQFREIKGIMTYGIGDGPASEEGRPDYGRAVDLLTKASLRAMILPSLLPVLFPIGLYGVTQWWFHSTHHGVVMLGGALLGMIITGFFMAISMTSGGGAWDNAKKYIELGNHGGKGSPAYMAAVIGDTVGDPYKDTSGPAINPLIKIVNLVALLLLAFL